MGGCAVVVIVLGIGYAAWVAVAGPHHITGPAQPATVLAGESVDPLGLVVPTIDQHFTLGHAALGDSFVAVRDPNWHIVVESPWRTGPTSACRCCSPSSSGPSCCAESGLRSLSAAMGASALVLSLGPHLHVDGHRTDIPLPFIVLTHVPLLDSSEAARWETYFWLFAALLLALLLDAVVRRRLGDASGRPAGRRRRRRPAGGRAPAPPRPGVALRQRSGRRPRVVHPRRAVPPAGSDAVVYPLATTADASSMLWQAMADMDFRMPGGFAVIPGPTGANTLAGQTSPLQAALAACGQARKAQRASRPKTSAPSWTAGGHGPWRSSRPRPARRARRRSSPGRSGRRAPRVACCCGHTSRRLPEPADLRQHGGMAHDRTFRFAAQLSKAPDGSALSWAAQARKAEDLGYSALLMPDHFGDQLAPVPALAAVAAATTTLRMGSLVFGNDYRHPFVLAKEAATLDVLSDGRFEMSLGAGWMRTDYDEAGLAYDHPAVRVARFEEAVKVVQGLLRTDGPFNFHGEHYEVLGHTLTPRPVQRPGPPLIIGGGGKRVLSFAARHADIVSINVNLREGTGGAETAADATPERTRTKIGWVKEAAGDRFAELELNSLIGFVMVTDDAQGLADQMAPAFGIDPADALHVPLALIGTLDEMAEELEWRRAEYGISYWSIESDAWETLGPVVARLAGT